MNQEQKDIIDRLDRIEQRIAENKPKLLSLKEAASYLDISQSYLYKLTSQARIPHYKPEGKRVYFDRSQLDDWLRRNPVKTRAEIKSEATKRVAQPWQRLRSPI